jgi:hypothetical protein
MTGFTLLVLLLHIGGAIIAFGPSFAFPIIGSMGAAEPAHGNFALRAVARITKGIVIPLAIFQGITGIALIWLVPIDLTKAIWLDVAIILYVIALGISLFWQRPAVDAMIEATSTPPPPPAPGAAPPAGPPPHIAALGRRIQIGGISLSVLIVLIIILMVLGSNGFF